MKKIYTIWLSAIVMMLAAFEANAALTTTFRWNVPGSVDIYVGGTGAGSKAIIAADATEYVATIDNTYGSAYIAPKSGYEFNSVVADGTTIAKMYNGMYRIDMSTYDGKTVDIDVETIVYDATFSLDVINGRDALTVTMWGTGREVKVVTGKQEIAYSSKYETGVDIQAAKDGAVDPRLTQNGIEMEWQAYYNWDSTLSHKYNGTSTKGFSFEDGTNFTVKYCDTDDEGATPTYGVTLDFADSNAEAALVMAFNITQMKTICDYDNIEVNPGDEIRLVFNTKDYVVSVDGNDVLAEIGAETSPYVITINADTTVNIAVSEREYGNTTITFAAANIEGLVLREGSLNGPVIDNSTLTSMGTMNYSYQVGPEGNTVRKSAVLTIYQAEVSLKSPKIYFDDAEGYWSEASECEIDGDVVSSTLATPDNYLKVVNFLIVRDTPVVVYVATDGVNAKAEQVYMRDAQRNEYALTEGYNELMFDIAYSGTLSLHNFYCAEGSAFAVFQDMSGIGADADTGLWNCELTGSTVLHVFAGRPAASEYAISAYMTPDAADAEIVVDRIRHINATGEISTFRNCEVKVAAGEQPVMVDGVAVEAEGAYTFNATKDHSIVIGNVAKIATNPAEGAELEEVTDFVISFPNATEVALNEELIGDMVMANDSWTFYCLDFTVAAVNGARVPTFRVTPAEAPARSGNYHLTLPEGLFTVQGAVASEEFVVNFSLAGNLSTEDITVVCDPADSEVSISDFYGFTIIFGEEPYEYTDVDVWEGIMDASVKVGGVELAMYEDYGIELKANMLMIMFNELDIIEPTTVEVYLPQGSLLIEGVESPEVSLSWTLLPAGIRGDLTGDNAVTASDLTSLIDLLLNGDYLAAGDLNDDYEITVSDITAMIELILGGSEPAPAEPEAPEAE